ncbi:MAG: hypothetical protein ACYCQJ_10770 [Nitrososphaerales archaeon]
MTSLDACEEVTVLRMYNEGLVFMDYKAINTVRSKIRWDDLARKYDYKKKFTRVLDRLKNTGLVDYHGKSGDVASLTKDGVQYARALIKTKKYPEEGGELPFLK